MSTAEVIWGEVEYLNKLVGSATSPELKNLLELKAMMLLERVGHYGVVPSDTKPSFKESYTRKYLVACVKYRPGLTRVELKEFAAIPGSLKRNETDTFRDYLIAVRKEIYLDEHGKCWPRNGLEFPIARIGTVTLDGRISPTLKKALVFLRDYPGTTSEELRKRLGIRSSKTFRSLLSGLKTKTTCDSAGRMFVNGYIPNSSPTPTPEKSLCKPVEDPLADLLLDQMEKGVVYDWSEVVPIYRQNNITPKDGYHHFMNMVTRGAISRKGTKFSRVF